MLGVTGISFKSAPLEIRERYSFTEQEMLGFLKLLKIDPDLQGAVIISTCNRIEIYYHCDKCCTEKAFDGITRNLEYFKNTSSEERKYFYHLQGEKAAEHLFRVVSGLESLVLGEDQIVTQVKCGFRVSLDNNFSSPVLTRMFNKAFEAGKRVRTETTINQGSASISSAAVELLCEELPDITEKTITLIGTGVMGELATVNLVKRNCRSLYITNRTHSKAVELAEKHNIKAFEFENLHNYLPISDIIIVATGAQHHIINREMLKEIRNNHTGQQIFVDLSVPRNISTDILQIPGIKLFAVDDLQEIVKDTKNKRAEAVADAMEIIGFVLQEFSDWLCALDLTPCIRKIQKNMDAINQSELEGFCRINGIQDYEMIARYADHISKKYSRLFIRNLKQVTENGRQRQLVSVLNQLFDISENGEAK
jgi:glutamyl-tRNA reductase